MMGLMHNLQEKENQSSIDVLIEKQDYFDFIDTDMEAYYAIKSEAVAPNV